MTHIYTIKRENETFRFSTNLTHTIMCGSESPDPMYSFLSFPRASFHVDYWPHDMLFEKEEEEAVEENPITITALKMCSL